MVEVICEFWLLERTWYRVYFFFRFNSFFLIMREERVWLVEECCYDFGFRWGGFFVGEVGRI